MRRAGQRDIAQALDAVGLPEQGAHLLVERQGRLVAAAGFVMRRAGQRDIAQALDAVGLVLCAAELFGVIGGGADGVLRAAAAEADELGPSVAYGEYPFRVGSLQPQQQQHFDVGRIPAEAGDHVAAARSPCLGAGFREATEEVNGLVAVTVRRRVGAHHILAHRHGRAHPVALFYRETGGKQRGRCHTVQTRQDDGKIGAGDAVRQQRQQRQQAAGVTNPAHARLVD